jgi:hypothetical protein
LLLLPSYKYLVGKGVPEAERVSTKSFETRYVLCALSTAACRGGYNDKKKPVKNDELWVDKMVISHYHT